MAARAVVVGALRRKCEHLERERDGARAAARKWGLQAARLARENQKLRRDLQRAWRSIEFVAAANSPIGNNVEPQITEGEPAQRPPEQAVYG